MSRRPLKPSRRVGLMGGAFDPIHKGHVAAALAARRACGLDEVWMVVTSRPPHKSLPVESIRHRIAMLRLALRHRRGVKISFVEARRIGVRYAITTLRLLHQRYSRIQWTYVMGADAAKTFPSWKSWREFPRWCRIAIVTRPGMSVAGVKGIMRRCRFREGREFEWVAARTPPVSSTMVRSRRGERWVSRDVLAYIRRHHLYGR